MRPYCFFIAANWNRGPLSGHFRALAKELAARGHRVILLIGNQKHKVDHEGRYSVHTWPSDRPTGFRDALFLYRLIGRFHPDCLISNFAASNIMLLVGKLTRVPCRIDWYHTMSTAIDQDARISSHKIRLLRARKRLVYRAATNIVAVSEAARKDINAVFGVPERKCAVLYNLLPDPFEGVNSSCSGPRENKLVCVGRLEQCKGQDVLIKAIALLRDRCPDWKVEFLGEGPASDSLSQLARHLGVSDRCIFSGNVRHDEVLMRMAKAAATVVPSRSEGFGIVNIESLAVGTPVIASAVGGIVEVIRDGVDGFLVPPDDPSSLGDKICALLSSPELRQKMSARGRERFLAFFELNHVVSRQAEWLESVVSSKQTAR